MPTVMVCALQAAFHLVLSFVDQLTTLTHYPGLKEDCTVSNVSLTFKYSGTKQKINTYVHAPLKAIMDLHVPLMDISSCRQLSLDDFMLQALVDLERPIG